MKSQGWRRTLCGGITLGAAALSAAVAQEPARNSILEIDVGAGYVDDSSPRFGKYNGLDEQGLEPLLDLLWASEPDRNSGDTLYWRIEGTRLGRDTRRLQLAAGQHGTQHLRVGYRQLPRNLSIGYSPFVEAASGTFGLPGGWVATGDTTAGMPLLPQSLGELRLREERRRFDLDYLREFGSAWSAQLEYRYERRDGRRAMAGMFGSNGGNARAALLPAPVDDATQRFGLHLSRQASDYHVSVSYQASLYRQDEPLLRWQNPFGQHPQWGTGTGYPEGAGQLARDPDNRFHQLQLGGSYRFAGSFTASLVAARGRLLQDEQFAPYTVNPLLPVDAPLPRESLDGRIDTTLIDLRITGRLTPALNMTTSLRLDDRDNDTPVATWRYVPADSLPQVAPADARLNRPYSFNKRKLSSDFRYRHNRAVRLAAGFSYSKLERDFSEVNASEEYEYSAGVRIGGLGNVALKADYRYNERKTDPYIGNRPLIESHVPGAIAADDFENHPLLRKYYLAARDRNQVRLRGDWTVGARLALGAEGSYSRDDYQDAIFGLNEAGVASWSADAAWSPADDVHATLFFGIDRFTSEQAGRSFAFAPAEAQDPDRNWFYDSRDRFESAGLDLRFEQAERWFALPGALELSLELRHAHSRSDIDVATGPALASAPLPDLYTRLNSAAIRADYALGEQASLRLGLLHERYRSADFALDDVQPATIPAVLTFGEGSPQYNVNWVSLSYRRSF